MFDPSVDELPILRELGDDLKASFRAHEATARQAPRQPRLRSRWLVGAACLAAGAVAAAIAFIFGVQGGSPTPPSATAALIQAAAVAEHRPVPFPGDNQFYYVRTVTAELQIIRAQLTTPLAPSARPVPTAVMTVGTQLWFSANRTGVTKGRVISVKFQTAAARRLWERLGRPSFPPPPGGAISPLGRGRYLLGNIELTRRQLLATSTDPRVLYAKLYAAGGSPAEVFTEIGDTLRDRPAPARLRAALYRTLALVPGVRLVGPVTDSVGRRGTAVGFVQDGVEDELIFDPASSDMLAERTIITDGFAKRLGLRPGTVTTSTTYLQRAVTDTVTTP
jgi:hypothetical protein